MSAKQENLTHEELWDDSALIDSWNAALEEYKKYHSIHAKGGSVRELESKSQAATKQESSPDRLQDVELIEPEQPSTSAQEAVNEEASSSRNEPQATPQGLPSFPVQAVLGSVKDENLKKLLMSWYYAGYYTGLFEGQQQAQQNRGS
ncbi:SMN domain-containing protein [Fusarium sp. LHS14.1]|nr:SMN domain-containing protein [Fusarium sp. LHS14.1]